MKLLEAFFRLCAVEVLCKVRGEDQENRDVGSVLLLQRLFDATVEQPVSVFVPRDTQ